MTSIPSMSAPGSSALGGGGEGQAVNPSGAVPSSSLSPSSLSLVQLLETTLSPDPATIRFAAEELERRTSHEGFAKDLLVLLVEGGSGASPAARQAGAIYFKNYIRRLWDIDPQQGGICEANRVLIKEHLLSLLLAPSTPKPVQLQLTDALTRIAETDFPLEWPHLLLELTEKHLRPRVVSLSEGLSKHALLISGGGGAGRGEDEMQQYYQQQKVVLQQLIAAMDILHAVLKKYRSAIRSDEILYELQKVLPVIQSPLHEIFGVSLKLLEQAVNERKLKLSQGGGGGGMLKAARLPVMNGSDIFHLILLSCKVFFSLNAVDLPEFFEDHMNDFLGGFLHLLSIQTEDCPLDTPDAEGDDETPGILEKVWSQICLNLKLYSDKYQEEFQPYVTRSTHSVWQTTQKIDARQRYDFLASSCMDFLSSAASTAWQQSSSSSISSSSSSSSSAAEGSLSPQSSGDPFADSNFLKEICEKVIVPNIQLRDCDVELMEDAPLEYTRRDLEGGDHHTRRSSALELVKSLSKLHENEITELILHVVNLLLVQANNQRQGGCEGGGQVSHLKGEKNKNEEERERLLDACTFLVMAIGVKGMTRLRGVQAVNSKVNVQNYFETSLLNEFKKPDVNANAIVRIASLKVIAAFRGQFDVQLLQNILPLLVGHLASSRVVVHTYAAYTLERLLTVKENGQHRLTLSPVGTGLVTSPPGSTPAAAIAPLLKKAVEMLLRILQDNSGGSLDSRAGGIGTSSSSVAAGGGATAGRSASGGSVCENEFIVKCLYRVFNFLKADATPDISLPALGMVLEMIKRVSSNPSNPSFSHFLFESLATIVKVLTVSQEYRPTVEAQVVPVLSVLIQQTVHDFIPYCFQILGLLLETADERSASSSGLYIELYGHLLQPGVWTASRANVPGLIRLLAAYCRRHILFSSLIQTHMQTLLERFQYCLYHKKLMGSAFDLLNIIFKYLPFSFYSSYFNMLLTVLLKRVHELNKKKSLCRDVCISLMLFQCKSEDPSTLVNALETIQPGLSHQVLSFIVLPAVLASPTSPLHVKKVLILGLARMATCPAVMSGNKQLLGSTLEALSMLISKKEEDERNIQRTQAEAKELILEDLDEDGDGIGGGPTAAEFDLCYARLAAADPNASKDLVEDVTDVQGSVQSCLRPLKADIEELASRGAEVRPLLAVMSM